MADLAVERYRKGVEAALDRWQKKVKPVADLIEKANLMLKELLQNKSPSPEEKKKIENCKATREKLTKMLDKFAMELKLDLSLLEVPQKGKADEKELIKLPGVIKDLVKKKGISLGTVTIKPQVDIDFKSFKIKEAGVIVEFTF